MGAETQGICRKHGITEQTFYRWPSKPGGIYVSEARKRPPFITSIQRNNTPRFRSISRFCHKNSQSDQYYIRLVLYYNGLEC